MAQIVPFSSGTLVAGVYGPFVVDGIPANAKGVRLLLDRGASGVWPLTIDDDVLEIDCEAMYAGIWRSLAHIKFFGGRVPPLPAPALLQAFAEIGWARENPSRADPPVWVFQVPSQARITITVHADLQTGGSFQWL